MIFGKVCPLNETEIKYLLTTRILTFSVHLRQKYFAGFDVKNVNIVKSFFLKNYPNYQILPCFLRITRTKIKNFTQIDVQILQFIIENNDSKMGGGGVKKSREKSYNM